ncbi:M28 family metallopeptidase [Flavisolibacter nicotianae]|uniref:M28 family metallopeptidase n=1 Tax=Flavisolibacter nicotianae TaxID=2364882 RepID=UPI000EB2892A|nr:M28 family peptidase [Flavisolibacter nicotianae]
MKKTVCAAGLLLLLLQVQAQKKNRVPVAGTNPPALASIKEADLQRDLYAMAADHFRGREAGTLDELRASMWWAEELRKEGLQPAGDDGTYFQYFNLYRNRISPASTVAINRTVLGLWSDVLIAQTAPATLSVPVVYVGKGAKEDLDKADIRGKAVAIQASTEGLNLQVSLPERRYMGYVLNKYRTELTNRGAAAIIFLADAMGEKSWSQVVPAMSRGLYDVEGGANATVSAKPPVLWLHGNAVNRLQNGATLTVNITVESFLYPSVNIVAKAEGTDKALKNEYVLFSGHQDHDGVRQPYGTDSIYNGADDNATVSVALMAIARAFKKAPGKRSALFVWHGAEERGLLGSRWYSAHPTVPATSIVAVLNGDMMGRNSPDSAALLGAQPPHRNSPDLVAMAMEANNEGPKFKLDTLWDKPTHVEGWYFRSDHLPYARAGFPAVFYTSLLHPNYHTPMDEADRIDYGKLKRMTEWMYRTGWKVANAASRPKVDEGFKLER